MSSFNNLLASLRAEVGLTFLSSLLLCFCSSWDLFLILVTFLITTRPISKVAHWTDLKPGKHTWNPQICTYQATTYCGSVIFKTHLYTQHHRTILIYRLCTCLPKPPFWLRCMEPIGAVCGRDLVLKPRPVIPGDRWHCSATIRSCCSCSLSLWDRAKRNQISEGNWHWKPV